MWGFGFLGIARFGTGLAAPGSIAELVAWYRLATHGDGVGPTGEYVGSEINTRTSPKHAVNDEGNLETVPDYQTFFTDSDALYEPSATTYVAAKLTPQGGGASEPLGWNAITGVYTSELDNSGLFYWLSFSSPIGQSNSIFKNGLTLPANSTINLSVDVKDTSTRLVQRIISLSNYTDISNIVYKLDGVVVPDTEPLNGFTGTIELIADIGTDNVGGVGVGAAADGVESSDVTLSVPMLTVGDQRSASLILADTAPTTRDSDKPTVPSSDAWVASEFYASDSNRTDTGTSEPFVKGIRRISDSTFQIVFVNSGDSTGTVSSNFRDLANVNWVGAFLMNNPEFTVTAGNSPNQIAVSHNNRPHQYLYDTFGNDGTNTNRYPIAFQYSVYGENNDLAGVKQIRADAGDGTEWDDFPTDNFQISFDVVRQGGFEGKTGRLIHLRHSQTGKVFELHEAGGSGSTYNLRWNDQNTDNFVSISGVPNSANDGDLLQVVITFSSGTLNVTINGLTSSTITLSSLIEFDALLRLSNDHLNRAFAGKYSNFKVERLVNA